MTRRVLVIVAGLFLLLAVGLALWIRSASPPEATVARTAPAEVPVVARLPVPVPAPATTPEPARAAPRRPAETPRPTAAPVPLPSRAEAPPTEGTLHFESDVPGAQVFIDRQFIGNAPITAEHVKPGPHRLNASVAGFDGVVETIEVSPGSRDITFRFREIRLDAKLAVIHKHRIGSCSGQLVATPQGIRYETTDKDDAFRASLLDLETFQVDYLEKNLRVKVRKGKQYNFTDPEANADRLFVFHRDVEKVRDRLRKE